MVKSSLDILSLRPLAVYVDVFCYIYFPVDMMSQCFFTQLALREDSFIAFVGETSLRHSGGRALLPDVSVKVEIIDFLLPQIKEKLFKNTIITLHKLLIEIDYIQPLMQFMREKLGACFGPGPFILHNDQDHDQRIIFWGCHSVSSFFVVRNPIVPCHFFSEFLQTGKKHFFVEKVYSTIAICRKLESKVNRWPFWYKTAPILASC